MQTESKNHHRHAASKTGSCCRKTDETADTLKDLAREAGREARHLLDAAGDEMSDAGHTLAKQVKAKPVQASLIALGLGFMAGLVFRRR